jgi:hypothetical protein
MVTKAAAVPNPGIPKSGDGTEGNDNNDDDDDDDDNRCASGMSTSSIGVSMYLIINL